METAASGSPPPSSSQRKARASPSPGAIPKLWKPPARRLGPNALAIQADVTDIAQFERAVAAVAEKFGKLDVVFANAGVGGATPLGQTKLSTFEKILQTNLTSVFFTVQAALPHLNDGASIILNGSVHAVMGVAGGLPTRRARLVCAR